MELDLMDKELPDLGEFQSIHSQLYQLFSEPSDNAMTLGAFFAITDSDAFFAGYQGIREAFENEHDFPPHVHYFGGLANAKCKVQKG